MAELFIEQLKAFIEVSGILLIDAENPIVYNEETKAYELNLINEDWLNGLEEDDLPEICQTCQEEN